ncbi:peptidylprolyl isomerase [Paenibacillus sp. N1-5-1-14]|uniref:peptidylprolyl isomerase n=1 Tax=Paenibacillus radicibacter TaxID=2972488 RepID=UPI002158A90A|nr:peptidylprolyl isomerase [Paenibacillus radicibacter]MCR8643410.1 peptidylprolyl isomerase [Paenibacillus radicibacter]
MKSNRLCFTWILLLIVTSILLTGCRKESSYEADTTVMRINGEDVALGELELQLQDSAADVMRYFHEKYSAQDSKHFWTDSYQNEIPIEVAKRKAVEKLTRIKVEQMVAKEKGIISDTSFSSFQAKLKSENQRRTEALSKGQVVYGPKEFRAIEYLSYDRSKMMEQLFAWYRRNESQPNREALQGLYNKMQQQENHILEKPGQIHVQMYRIDWEAKPGAMTQDQVVQFANTIRSELTSGRSSETILQNNKGLVTMSDRYIPNVKPSNDLERQDPLLQQASMLRVGELSDVITDDQGVMLIRCLNKTDGGVVSFDEAREVLHSMYMEESLNSMIEDKVLHASLEVMEDVYSSVKMR